MRKLIYITLLFSQTLFSQVGVPLNNPKVMLVLNKNGLIGPSITGSSGTFLIDYGDGVSSSTVGAHTYTDGSTKVMKLFVKSGSLTNFTYNNGGIISGSVVDLRNLTSATIVQIANATGLIGVLHPINAANISQLVFLGDGYLGNFDLSSYSNLGGDIEFQSNSGITSVTTASSSKTFTKFYFNGLSSSFTTIDLSVYLGLQGDLRGQSNSGLATAPLPANLTGPFTNINFSACALTQSAVDSIYVKVDRYFTIGSPHAPTATLTITTSGGTNSAPSSTGLAAITSIQAKFTANGKTFNVSHN
jgi:hypothetical protein